MGNHAEGTRNTGRKSLVTPLAALAVLGIAALLAGPRLRAQSTSSHAEEAQPQTPQWQIDAGGKMEFDVASVKQDNTPLSPQTVHSNVPLGPQDMYSPTGGLLSATNFPLIQYIVFAYKLTSTQFESVQSQLPKWATANHYDIQARGAGNPTKDQFRLMMQALLADRFKLAIHYEIKQQPIFALVLDKPGKLGPKIQPHPAGSPCSTAGDAPGAPPTTVAGGFPELCGAFSGWPVSGRIHVGARNVPMEMIATYLTNPQLIGADRAVIDKTGLAGKYDFIVEFTPQISGSLPPGVNFQPDESGPTFLEALKEQLGLKLDSQTGPVPVVVIDHVEPPSEN